MDKIGQRFGKILVTGIAPKKGKSRNTRYYVLCDCGHTFDVSSAHLSPSNHITGCAVCNQGGRAIGANATHGATNSRLYRIWTNIKGRCLNDQNYNYYKYGGRGIKICQEWIDSFEKFKNDMGQPPSNIHSVDRRDNNGNYEPSNCRWATPKEQAANRRPRRTKKDLIK